MEEAEEDGWSFNRSKNASPDSQAGQESGASTPLMSSLVPYGRDDSESRNRMEMSEERRNKLREIEVGATRFDMTWKRACVVESDEVSR